MERGLDNARNGLSVAGARTLAAPAADVRVDHKTNAVVGQATGHNGFAVERTETALTFKVVFKLSGEVFDGGFQCVIGVLTEVAERRNGDHFAEIGEAVKTAAVKAVILQRP